MTRPFVALLGAGAVLGALLILLLASGSASPTHAAGDIGTIGIDTNVAGNTVTACPAVNAGTGVFNDVPPTPVGNTGLQGQPPDYPCNTSTILGTTDTCASIAVGATVQIDVVGKDIPLGGADPADYGVSGKGAGQSDMALKWSPSFANGDGANSSHIAVTAKDFTVALIHQGADDNPSPIGVSGTGTSDGTGRGGNWKWTDIDINTDFVAEGGQGIAIRLTITGMSAGTATLSLAKNLLPSGPSWTDVNNNEYSVGTLGGATIAVGQACPAATNTPTPVVTNSPTPVPTNSPTPVPTQSPTASPTPSTSQSPTPSTSQSPTPSTSQSPTPSPSPTPAPTPTPTNTPSPSPTPSTTHTNTPTPAPSATPTQTPTATPPTSASASPTPRPTCNTTLATSANTGSSTISVVSALGCDPGDTIRISGGTSNQEDIKIAGGTTPATTSLTLAAALTKNHAAGDTVVEIASAATPTPSPKILPPTGGVGSSGNTTALLLMLLLGGALIAAAGGAVFVARAKREE